MLAIANVKQEVEPTQHPTYQWRLCIGAIVATVLEVCTSV